MTRISRETTRSIHESERDNGNQTVQWNGMTLVCVPAKSIDLATLGLGGTALSSDARFFISTDRFPDTRRPQSKQLLFSGSTRYWIDTVNTSADGAYVQLDCNLPESKA